TSGLRARTYNRPLYRLVSAKSTRSIISEWCWLRNISDLWICNMHGWIEYWK
ncbi:hypothetical protein GIB67_032463, partial [Kingdonia uniflora]